MLVKESVVAEWYKKNHFIYKSFSYLFQNPLWNTRIPGGFSVCPYFWAAVLVSPLFRMMIVWPILFFIRPLIKYFFLGFIDQILFTQCGKAFTNMRNYMPGMGIFIALGAVLGVGVIGFLATLLGMFYFNTLEAISLLGMSKSAFLLVFWTVLSGVVTIAASAIYKMRSYGKCKVEGYLYLWALLAFIASLFIDPWAFPSIVIGTATVVADFAGAVCHGIAVAFAFIGHWAWVALTLKCGSWNLWLSIIALMGCLSLFGWSMVYLLELVDKLICKISPTYLEKKAQKKDYTYYWVREISNQLFRYYGDNIESHVNLALLIKVKLYPEWIRVYIQDFIYDKFPVDIKQFADVDPKEYEVVKRKWSYAPAIAHRISNIICCDSDNFIDVIVKRLVEDDLRIRTIVYKTEVAKTRSAKMDVWCQWTTGNLDKYVGTPVVGGFHIVGRGSKFLFRNVLVGCAFLWEIIKAKKKNACPFMMFKDE